MATITLIFVLLLDFISRGAIRESVRGASGSVWRALSAIFAPIESTGLLSSRRALEAENETLKSQVASLQTEKVDNEMLTQENQSLRALVHLVGRGSGVTAPVVSSFRASPYGTFLIGAGSDDKIGKGSLVEADASGIGIVIGSVTDVGKKTSLVSELFAPTASLDVLVHGVGLVAVGEGGGNARAQAPRNALIGAGDLVVAPQLGERVVGVVGSVEKDATDTSLNVYINIPVSFASLQYVYVVGQ